MATIIEVAEKAGVSIKTVSRVMNGYVHVSQKTKQKVEDAMAALDYTPSTTARQMRLGASQSIGILFGDPSSGYQSELNHSMLRACAEGGRFLAVELFNEKDRDWVSQVSSFLDRTKVSNLVLVPPISDSIEVHKLLRDRDVHPDVERAWNVSEWNSYGLQAHLEIVSAIVVILFAAKLLISRVITASDDRVVHPWGCVFGDAK